MQARGIGERLDNGWGGIIVTHRTDAICALLLAFFAMLLWCSTYNRWTGENWGTPLAYISSPDKGDVVGILAGVRAARDGHVWPFQFLNIPELGAPYVANWDDYPSTEKLLLTFPGLLGRIIGIFAAANFMVMAGQVLSAVSFFAACRLLGDSRAWSCAGAIIFAFSRFTFAHGLHHFTIGYYWHMPLCLVVCGWIFNEEGINLRERRFIFAVIVAFVTGIQNVYFTNIFAQFVLFGGFLQWWRSRDWRAVLPAAAIIGVAALAFLLMNLNTFIYHLVHGPNTGAVVRAYRWLEIYALKIVDLVVPPPDHHLSFFGRFGAWHMGNVVLSPGEIPMSGYIGLTGIAVMIWLLLVSLKKVVTGSRLPLESWMILWILLYAGVGGLNCLIGSFGFQLFRATTRYSIVILCILLMYAVRRFSLVKFKNPVMTYAILIAITFVALWDQLPPTVTAEELQETASQMASDRHFTERMEQRLPPASMVFQLPIMEYPESPAPGVGSYDHFRPYLYSNHLRYSFGSDKGRPREKWQQGFGGASLRDIINRLESYGFAAIYINRNGFPDKGEGMLNAFKDAGRAETIISERQDLVCVFLKYSPQPVMPDGGLYR